MQLSKSRIDDKYTPWLNYKKTVRLNELNDFLSEYDYIRVYSAIEKGELKTAHGNLVRYIDLSAWVEEQRFKRLVNEDPLWKKELYEYGYSVTNLYISNSIIKDILNVVRNESELNKVGFSSTEFNRYGDNVSWRWLRLFGSTNIFQVFELDCVKEIGRVIYGSEPYIIDNITILCKPPETSAIAIHFDVITVMRNTLKYPAVLFSIDLTDPNEADGGLIVLPKSHRIQNNGRMLDIPNTREGFVSISNVVGQIKIHNSGIFHATKINVTKNIRYTFYVTLTSVEAGTVRREKYKDNNSYIYLGENYDRNISRP